MFWRGAWLAAGASARSLRANKGGRPATPGPGRCISLDPESFVCRVQSALGPCIIPSPRIRGRHLFPPTALASRAPAARCGSKSGLNCGTRADSAPPQQVRGLRPGRGGVGCAAQCASSTWVSPMAGPMTALLAAAERGQRTPHRALRALRVPGWAACPPLDCNPAGQGEARGLLGKGLGLLSAQDG